MNYEEIMELISNLKKRKLTHAQMANRADCFLKIAKAETGEKFGLNHLIKRANSDVLQIGPLLDTEIMTAPKLAHVMIGCQKILEDIEIIETIKDLEKICKIQRKRDTSLLMPEPNKPKKSTWNPMS